MSSNPALNDEQWSKLLEQAASAFNEVTLNRGYQYFKQQLVVSLNISENRVIQAKVTGSEDYKVTLHLDSFRSSFCTCPVQAYCKHLAAVMMELADRLGYPASHIVNAKQHLKRTQSGSSSKLQLHQLPNMDVLNWHKFLNELAAPVKPSYDQGIFAEALRYQLHNIRNDSSIPFSAVDRIYFELHQELFIIQKLNEQNAQGSVNYYTSFALYRIYDQVHALLQQKSALFNFTLAGERLKQTLSYIRQRMAEESGHKYLSYGLYTALWKHWILPHSGADPWASQEIGEIEKQTTIPGSTSLPAAKAYLYLLQSRGSEAWAALETSGMLDKAPASLFLPFLNQICASRNWVDLVDWLIRTAPSFYGPRIKELNAYLAYWKEAVEHYPAAEQHLWSVLEGMLPHSMPVIEDVLYEQHKWKSWVEMQILQGHDPLYHRVTVLQPIEKEAPELLLPYYHQAIESYVSLKNRQAYKSAVKLLRRLEKVYKRLKNLERWDRFFAGFMERNSRLRALQEEMKKGKLLE